MKLLLATGNPAKVAVLRWMLDGLAVEMLTPAAVRPEPAVEEGAESVRANAEAKARAWAMGYGVTALATDGGLAVPALGERWNPALTRRAAGADATDAERAAHLLRLMEGLRGAERTGFMVEAVALAVPARGHGSWVMGHGEARDRGLHGGRSGGEVVVQSWEVRGEPLRVAERYDPSGLPPGFWLPGVLEPKEAHWDVTRESAERSSPGDHWHALRGPVREAVADLLREAESDRPGVV